MRTISSITGFSLVELSVVLVILGLLTGGILGGQALIHAAELRAVTTEHQQWQTAANTFRHQYFQLPGDMDNATRFWPDDGTDNGNGNGYAGDYAPSVTTTETFLFWQHLALAGMVAGTYTGEMDSDSIYAIGQNLPVSKYESAGWAIISHSAPTTPHTNEFPLDNLNAFALIRGDLSTPPFTPEDAWNIDRKFDDGKPARGNMITLSWPNCTTATDNTQLDSDYALSNSSSACMPYFRNSF